MENQGQSIKEFKRHQTQGGRGGVAALFFIGAIVVLLFMAWTASHNLPMMTRGTEGWRLFFGGAAALIGEFIVGACFVLLFFTAGKQRAIVFGVEAIMSFVLLFNSCIAYAQDAAKIAILDELVTFYGSFIAPFPIFIVALVGVHLIIESSPIVRERNVRHVEDVNARERQTTMRAWTDAKMDDLLDLPQVQEPLLATAYAVMIERARDMVKQLTGKELNDAEIRAMLAEIKTGQAQNHQATQTPMRAYGLDTENPSRTKVKAREAHRNGNGQGENPLA